MTTDTLSFGGARLDQARRVVADATGRETVLRAKSYDVLVLLLNRPDTVVTKDELFEKVWNGAAVSEDTLVQCITEIRKAIGQSGHEALKTITKVGYRLVFDVVSPATTQQTTAHVRPIHPRGVAVLPFANLSVDQEQDFLADGLAEDIITALSGSADLFVIARHSSFSFRGKIDDLGSVASELGVRYIVEGRLSGVGKTV
jgi:adenylate cyclase